MSISLDIDKDDAEDIVPKLGHNHKPFACAIKKVSTTGNRETVDREFVFGVFIDVMTQ